MCNLAPAFSLDGHFQPLLGAELLILSLEDHSAISKAKDTGDINAMPRVAKLKGAAVAVIVHT